MYRLDPVGRMKSCGKSPVGELCLLLFNVQNDASNAKLQLPIDVDGG